MSTNKKAEKLCRESQVKYGSSHLRKTCGWQVKQCEPSLTCAINDKANMVGYLEGKVNTEHECTNDTCA